MKKFVLWIGLMVLGSLQAQEAVLSPAVKDSIRKELNAYFEAVSNKDWDYVLDRMPPELFELEPREKLLKKLKDAQNDYVQFEIHSPDSIHIFRPSYLKNGRQYFLAGYINNATWIFHKKPKETSESFHSRMDYTFYRLHKKMGNKIIRGNDPGIFHVRVPKYLLIIRDTQKGKVYFIEYPRQIQKQTDVQSIVPLEVLQFFNNTVFHHT
jgi:hypothetical protein